jgi:gluconate 5-dehydrogenase
MSFVEQLFGLDGRVALVTGSSGGIGRALAGGLAKAGAHVVVNGRDAARAEQAAADIRAAGGKATAMACDVTDAASVRALVERVEAEVGPIDILVNNAGMTIRAMIEDFAEDDWRKVMSLNLDSVFFVGQAVGRKMLTRGRGRIINICSVMSELARPGTAPYAATKGAVKMLTKAMATEWGRKGINVNGIGPGYFATELTAPLVQDKTFTAWLEGRTPLGRWGDVKELVGAAIFLASDAGSYVNGHILYVDGAMTATV